MSEREIPKMVFQCRSCGCIIADPEKKFWAIFKKCTICGKRSLTPVVGIDGQCPVYILSWEPCKHRTIAETKYGFICEDCDAILSENGTIEGWKKH